ncbi:MAG: trigger factor [bacterium]|nr:trigger factor [bacterium]
MTHQTTILPKSEIEIEVTLPFEEFELHVKRAATALSEERDIEGFRKGKAPYDAVKQKFGEATIYERAAEHAVRKTYPNIVEDLMATPPEGRKEFLPIGSPDVTIIKLAPGNELIYKVKLSLMPAVAVPDYIAIAKHHNADKKEVAVSDEEIMKTIEWIRESRLVPSPVDRPAQISDGVEIDFEIGADSKKWENGQSKNHPLVIGKSKFIPGFEDHLIGMRANEEKKFSLTLPQDWHDKALAGKTIDVSVTMKSVKERILPELNDEFAKQLGTSESVDELKKNVSTGLMQEKKEKEQQRHRVLIIEAIAKDIKAELPDVLVEREREKMFDELKQGIEQMGMKFEDYLLHIKKTEDDLKKEWQEEAEKRVRVGLALREIANREHVSVTAEEIEEKSNEYLRQFNTPDGAQKQIDPERLQEYTKGILKNEKVFEFLENVK